MTAEKVGGKEASASESEERDFERVVQSVLVGKFEDWPNEAGFEGLTEVRGPVNLTVIGLIPSWAAGTLYRTGPGGYTIKDTPKGVFRITHWFDGFAHTHRFKIIADTNAEDGPVRVEYSSRHQAEQFVDAIRKLGRIPGTSFGQRQDPCIGLFGKIMSVFRREDPNSAANICVTVHADLPGFTSNKEKEDLGHRGGKPLYLHVGTDTSRIKEVHPETLEPIGLARQSSLHPLLKGPLSSAHAQRDPETGDLFNFNTEMGRCTTYRVFRTNKATGTTDILATINEKGVKPAYIHSFFLSPSFLILCIPSSHLGCMGISVPWNGNLIDAIEPFDESKLSKWFVVDRRGGRGVVASFETEAGFFFHSVNAFEEHDKDTGDVLIFCDAIEYPSTEIIRAYEMDALLNRNTTATKDENHVRKCLPRLVRRKFQVKAIAGETETQTQTDPTEPMVEKILEIKAPHVGELPTINPAYATQRYRYVYSLANHGYSTLYDTIVKTDLLTRQTVFWQGEVGHTPGEAIFVARPRSEEKAGDENAEDDGVLLSVVLDGFGKKSYLVCLDARSMQELGRAVCEWPVGFGFHGLHV
ncbi:carotenoid oxygenase [Xylaria sp. CBS 124048]|nr:carotenoid oxygenase [Xylaria sp. CBS 124048]